MGQLVSSADLRSFIEGNLQGQIAQVTGPYARLFQSSPTFVTYYSQDLAQGSADVNLGGTINIVGPESAIKYKSISDYVLYGIQQADLQTAYDDIQGSITGNITGEATILPGTGEPYENDFFTISFLDTQLLFRVSSVSADRLEGKAFFRVNYFLDQGSLQDLQKQVTENYQFDIGRVGSNFSPLIEQGLYLLLNQLALIEEKIKQSYWKAFYDPTSGTLILRQSGLGQFVHDNALDLFVSRNDVLSGNGYLSSRTIVPCDYNDYGAFLDTVYPRTMYFASENALTWQQVAEQGQLTNLVDLMPSRPITPASCFFELACTSGMTEAVPVPAPDGCPNYYVGGQGLIFDANAAVMAGYGYGDPVWGPTGTTGPAGPPPAWSSNPMQAVAEQCLAGMFRFPAGGDPKPAAAALVGALNDTAILQSRADFFWLGPVALMEANLLRQAATVTTD